MTRIETEPRPNAQVNGVDVPCTKCGHNSSCHTIPEPGVISFGFCSGPAGPACDTFTPPPMLKGAR